MGVLNTTDYKSYATGTEGQEAPTPETEGKEAPEEVTNPKNE